QDLFKEAVAAQGAVVTLRREKGHDIAAACGQLRLKQETDAGILPALVPDKRRVISTGAEE
ncbi:MAG: 23S rRNA (adenine(2503)-C(2))-methyltransferase RlmN, partial [Roseimicrobium sp.]